MSIRVCAPAGAIASLLCVAAAVALALTTGAAADGGWSTGRATWYDDDPSMTVDYGSCGYGYLDSKRFPGDGGPHVAALSDTFPGYSGSCGRCYEIKCNSIDFKDNYGEHLGRSGVCYDSEASLVVKITDTCPCNYPSNAYSNKRWCCGDMPHMDVSAWAFEKLADKKWGVISIQYRQVDCGQKPWKEATYGNGKGRTGRRSSGYGFKTGK